MITYNHCRKWLSRLASAKRSNALTATSRNDTGSEVNEKVGQKYVLINNFVAFFELEFYLAFQIDISSNKACIPGTHPVSRYVFRECRL